MEIACGIDGTSCFPRVSIKEEIRPKCGDHSRSPSYGTRRRVSSRASAIIRKSSHFCLSQFKLGQGGKEESNARM
jgi:hypothetical protein